MTGSGRKSNGGKAADAKTSKKETKNDMAAKNTRSSLPKADDKENKNKSPSTKKDLEAQVKELEEKLAKSKTLLSGKEAANKELSAKFHTIESQYNELKDAYDQKCKQPCANCQARQMMTVQPPQAQAPVVWPTPVPQAPVWQPMQQQQVWQPMQSQAPAWQSQPPTWHHQSRPQPPQYQGGYYQGGRRQGGGQNKGWYQPY